MKKVLVAIDYDPTAEKVAETGYALGKAMSADIILLHVIAEPSYYSSLEFSPIMGFTGFADPHIPELVEDALKKEALRFLDQSKEHLGDGSIKTLVAEGVFAETILKVAAAEQADIIVLGRHSRKGIGKILMGSVAEKVLHNSLVPVFIIPN
jgi:nucleotide-binding universal stress UspA family protein